MQYEVLMECMSSMGQSEYSCLCCSKAGMQAAHAAAVVYTVVLSCI